MLYTVFDILKHNRFDLQNEKKLQLQIKDLFIKKKLDFTDEYRLDKNNIVDFMVNSSIAVEVKISSSYSKKSIYRQCERYLKFDCVEALILVTGRSLGFPSEINGKPCLVFNLSKAWL